MSNNTNQTTDSKKQVADSDGIRVFHLRKQHPLRREGQLNDEEIAEEEHGNEARRLRDLFRQEGRRRRMELADCHAPLYGLMNLALSLSDSL
ncbi:uncharacterized protein TRAVEDRAFT_53867 [Trametes versicolor FP-101664 SS1]|uniref:uncharacterized protein n=1 Tax=Trametes versicolor (strain FP-101664) TaxID=717944 RepID=UPI0004622DFB|nr:uncharacterized protein TRAVEDRAFT_53867 [Trametes versicolor FP-101664 SS1]EIW52445.1 hypothetical protein TRAVEDRAFT_53867 [Trametes versicolor FP-101664 SS1]